jgi:heme exporter protein B
MINLLLKREIKNTCSEWGIILTSMLYFIVAISLINLAISNLDSSIYQIITGPVTWILMMMISIYFANSIFCKDLDDGSLDSLILSLESLHLLMVIKIFTHWLIVMLPLGVIGLVNFKLSGNDQSILELLVLIIPVTLTISAFVSLGSLMAYNTRLGSLLLGVLVLPLMLPLLIFASAATTANLFLINDAAVLKILFSLSILSLIFIPYFNMLIVKEVNQ